MSNGAMNITAYGFNLFGNLFLAVPGVTELLYTKRRRFKKC